MLMAFAVCLLFVFVVNDSYFVVFDLYVDLFVWVWVGWLLLVLGGLFWDCLGFGCCDLVGFDVMLFYGFGCSESWGLGCLWVFVVICAGVVLFVAWLGLSDLFLVIVV